MKTLHQYRLHLEAAEMSPNTIKSYTRFISSLISQGIAADDRHAIEAYIADLRRRCAPATVNLRIATVNSWFAFQDIPHRLKQVKVQRKSYVENVISHADYIYFKNRLRQDGQMLCHFAVWCLCASGARISELLKVTVDDLRTGHYEVCSKGGKIRRIYFPRPLCESALEWLASIGRTSGHVFLNRYGSLITPNGLARKVRDYARRYNLDPSCVHPHAFRHRFAINFLTRNNDLPLLADIMGHSSIDTTRIYLRRSADEQRRYLDSVVDW